VVFCGTFTAGGLDVEVDDGKLKILREGATAKFLRQVEHITFSGKYAWKKGQRVLFVTERAVFSLGETGLVLEEIAPGIDLEKDVLSLMESRPNIAATLRVMDRRIFMPDTMNLAKAGFEGVAK
ncbi:MAG TPA: acyl CoA:acetate/3-ketoacid CoA transferase, partial [Verrucomicrobiae bacterium]|nr:acyl CoA:acetate/3-ketoacid CoA transferase [Verrucomicrobiae bacterium]